MSPHSEAGLAAIEPSPLIDRAACIRADRKAGGVLCMTKLAFFRVASSNVVSVHAAKSRDAMPWYYALQGNVVAWVHLMDMQVWPSRQYPWTGHSMRALCMRVPLRLRKLPSCI